MLKPYKNVFFFPSYISNWCGISRSNKGKSHTMCLKLDIIIWWKEICRTAVLCLNKCSKTLSVHNMNCSDANFPFSFLFELKSLRYLKHMKPNSKQCVQRRKQRMGVQKYNRKMHKKVIKMHGINEKRAKQKFTKIWWFQNKWHIIFYNIQK